MQPAAEQSTALHTGLSLLDFLKLLWTGERINCYFPDNAWHRGASDTLWHLVTSGCLKYPHILSRARSKSPSNQNPASVILLTSYGTEIKTDIKTKRKSPQPSSPRQGLAKHSCLTALISHLLCHNQLSERRHVYLSFCFGGRGCVLHSSGRDFEI